MKKRIAKYLSGITISASLTFLTGCPYLPGSDTQNDSYVEYETAEIARNDNPTKSMLTFYNQTEFSSYMLDELGEPPPFTLEQGDEAISALTIPAGECALSVKNVLLSHHKGTTYREEHNVIHLLTERVTENSGSCSENPVAKTLLVKYSTPKRLISVGYMNYILTGDQDE